MLVQRIPTLAHGTASTGSHPSTDVQALTSESMNPQLVVAGLLERLSAATSVPLPELTPDAVSTPVSVPTCVHGAPPVRTSVINAVDRFTPAVAS
jgi:hypothetical protein